MRARQQQTQRSRQCRLHHSPPHLLQNTQQLLVRRLFQGTNNLTHLKPNHQYLKHLPQQTNHHHLPHQQQNVRPVEEDQHAQKPNHPHPNFQRFLINGQCLVEMGFF